MQTALIILAAGESKRMGTVKQLLPIEGKSILLRMIEEGLKTACYPISVVLGAHKAQIVPTLIDLPINLVDNSQWATGMASSIRMGLVGTYLIEKNIDSVIIVPADMPFVTQTILEELVSRAELSTKKIIACRYQGTLGVPVLFKRERFADLLELKEDEGARKLIAAHKEEVEIVDFPDGAIDLDTPEAYQQFIFRQN
ncbi:MAG: NTP transferase domain-containing protein [Spirosomataceae bacterium]